MVDSTKAIELAGAEYSKGVDNEIGLLSAVEVGAYGRLAVAHQHKRKVIDHVGAERDLITA